MARCSRRSILPFVSASRRTKPSATAVIPPASNRNLVDGLGLLERLLQGGLALVGLEDLRGVGVGVIGGRRVHPVALAVVGDGGVVEPPLQIRVAAASRSRRVVCWTDRIAGTGGKGYPLADPRTSHARREVVVITLVIPYGVLMRYVVNAAASWPEPAALLLMVVFSFLGPAYSPACLAREARGLSGDDVIALIRRLVGGAVEPRGEEEVVRRCDE